MIPATDQLLADLQDDATPLDAEWHREAEAARQAALQEEGERLLDRLIREDQRAAKAQRGGYNHEP